MALMIKEISVNIQSSIRIVGSKTIYFDPWQIDGEPHDGDVVFITHEHYDHFSPEDIDKVASYNGYLVVPASMIHLVGPVTTIPVNHVIAINPGETREVSRILVEAVPAYNMNKPFHIKRNNWVGYVVTIDGTRLYISGDTDVVPELRNIRCDIAFLGIGGKFSMDAKEAATLARYISPRMVIPTGYGSIVGTPVDGQLFSGFLPRDIKCDLLLDMN